MRIILTIVFIAFAFTISGQTYVELMEQRANFYEIKKKFEAEWSNKKAEKGKGWKQFKRWENFWEKRLYPSGNFIDPAITYKEYEKYFNRKSVSAYGNWSSMGPNVIPANGGVGRLNAISFHPTNPNIFWVGAGAGGVWKTSDGGNTWSTATDKLAALGMSNLVVDPVNPNVMYLATGDVDASDTYGTGVMKSTDGGNTWNQTGLNWEIVQTYVVKKIAMSPADHNTLFAATNNGLYKSTDGAFTWQRIKTGTYYDIEFKPGNPQIIYAVQSNKFMKSIDGGQTFNPIGTGLNLNTANRITIAVTPANPEFVYLLASSSNGYGFHGLFMSVNSGSSFTLKSNYPNILGWQEDGSDSGGQGWYDLALTASPVDPDLIFAGGVNIFRSYDRGETWECSGHWYGAGGIPYVHADIHDLAYSPHGDNKLYSCNDGGLFMSDDDGNSWTDLSAGLVITQIYRVGMDPNNENLFLAGNQDNGTNRFQNGQWEQVLGGDGMNCLTKGTTMYASIYYGDIYRSNNSGDNFTNISGPITNYESGAWVTPFVFSPQNSQTLFAGYNNLWKTTNQGNTWSKISDFAVNSTGEKIDVITVSPANANNIYITKYSTLYKTTNGGQTWDIVSGIPTLVVTSVTCHPTDASKVWITLSGYNNGTKVYFSNDNCATWQNISGTLPNVPVNTSIYQNNTNDAIYIGTDIGVFYKNNSLQDWIPYTNGLPNTIVSDMEIIYSKNTLRVSSYGRGVWQTPLFDFNFAEPMAQFSSQNSEGCPGLIVQYSDESLLSPQSWNWEFEGGNPAVSTEQNPVVQYDIPGTYSVKLTASNSNGQSVLLKENCVIVKDFTLPFFENFQAQSNILSLNKTESTKSRVFISSNDGVNTGYFLVMEGSLGYSDYEFPGTADPFSMNEMYNSKATLCVNATAAQSILLSFDLKLLYEGGNEYTNLRITANGQQIGSVFRPSGATTAWQAIFMDLSQYAGTKFELSFEANNRSVFNHLIANRGNAAMIDNINLSESTTSPESLIKSDFSFITTIIENSLHISSLNGKDETIEFELYNLLGQKIISSGVSFVNGFAEVRLGQISTGSYFVKISNGKNNFIGKVIKL